MRAPCAHQRKSIGLAIGKALRTNGALPHWLVKGRCLALPFPSPLCAHPRKGIGIAIGRALRTNLSARQKALQKASSSGSNFFSKTFPYPLALPSRFCYTCNRQQWAGPSEEARATPIPLRIERKNE